MIARKLANLVLTLTIFVALVLSYRSRPTIARTSVDAAGSDDIPVTLRLDAAAYQVSDCAHVTLADTELNQDPAKTEQVAIDLYGRDAPDQEHVTLAETGVDTGLFDLTGECVPLDGGVPVQDDGKLQVRAGDLIGALAMEPNGQEPRALDIATVIGGKQQGDFEAKVDSSILPDAYKSIPPGPDEQPLPAAMVIDPDGVPAFFGEDHVILRAATQQDLDDFLARRSGKVLHTLTIPIAEAGKADDELKDAVFYLVRVDSSAVDEGRLPYLMELVNIKGDYTYSSLNAVKLIAMVAEEQLAGTAVFPSALMQYQGVPRSNEGAHGNWLGQPWFTPGSIQGMTRAGEALSLLAIAEQPSTPVPVAFIDGGFASPADFGTGSAAFSNPDYPRPFATMSRGCLSPEARLACAAGDASGPNPLPCSGVAGCPWHGTQMLSVAGANFDNGFGAAGSGAGAVNPMLFKVGIPYIAPVAAAITLAVAATPPARVINISSGVPCRPLIVDVCDPLGNLLTTVVLLGGCEAVRFWIPPLRFLPCEAILALHAIPPQVSALQTALALAELRGAVVVSAAGNSISIPPLTPGIISPGPYDVDAVRVVPCVLAFVVCVGGLRAGTATPIADTTGSGFGASVAVWAPGTSVMVTPDPNSVFTSPGLRALSTIGGTSPAAAFVSGVVALARSLNPSLSAAAARGILLASGCHIARTLRTDGSSCLPSPASDRVNTAPGGYIDVLETLHQAGGLPAALIGCDGGWDEAASAADTPETAILLNGPSPIRFPPAGTRNISVHALPSDVDWYRYRAPGNLGGPVVDTTIELTFSGANGNLAMDIHYQRPTGPVVFLESVRATSGIATFRRDLPADRDFLIKVYAATPAATNDDCYGSTLTIQTNGVGVAPDRFELNDNTTAPTELASSGWTHRHTDARDAFTRQEIWTMTLSDLSLHAPLSGNTDRDFFLLSLPDPADPAQGGHDDIDPAPGNQPLVECGAIAATNTSAVFAASTTLRVRVEPLDTSAEGEAIWLYRNGAPDETLAAGRPMDRRILCPRGSHGLTELLFSFGERSGGRASLRYRLVIEYIVTMSQALPVLLLDEVRTAPLLCPPDAFPVCRVDEDSLRAVFEVNHPMVPVPDCSADGCPDLWYFHWSTGDTTLDLALVSEADLDYRLLNDRREPIAEAEPIAQAAAAPAAVTKRMTAPNLAPGLYILEVTGPPDNFTVDFVPPQAPAEHRVYIPIATRGS